jgi:hypothetical protein
MALTLRSTLAGLPVRGSFWVLEKHKLLAITVAFGRKMDNPGWNYFMHKEGDGAHMAHCMTDARFPKSRNL